MGTSATGIMTTEEAAVLLRCSTRTVLELLRQGRLPGKKIGRRWLILESDLRKSLKANNTAST